MVDLANRLPEQPGHFCDHRVGRAGHHLRFGDEIPRVIEDPVDAAREREYIFGLQRSHERGAQRAQQRSFGDIPAMLRVAHQLRGSRVAPGPRREGVHALDRHRDLRAQEPEHVGGLRQKPSPAAHVSHPQSSNIPAASAPVIGSVINHATPIRRTTSQ